MKLRNTRRTPSKTADQGATTTMKRFLAAVTVCLMSGCFNAPDERVFDGGINTDGGSSNTDAGTQNDAGVTPPIAPIAELPEANCGTLQVLRCPSGPDGCLTWETPGTQQVVARQSEFGELQSILGRVGDEFVYVSANAAGGSTMWTRSATTAPRALKTTNAGTKLQSGQAISRAPSGSAWWFVGHYVTGVGSGTFEINYVMPGGQVATAATKSAYPTSNGVAFGSNYVVALNDGLYSFSATDETRLVQTTGIEGDKIHSVDVDEANGFIFYVRYDGPTGDRLMRRSINSQDEVLMSAVPRVQALGAATGSSLSVHDGYVYVLSVLGLYRIPVNTPGQLELVFAGEEFPQYGGTLQNLSLVRHGDKLYFGKVCHHDADAPGYGTIELDITQRSVRWLDLDPAYPVVPHVASYDSWPGGPVFASPAGAFIMRN